MADVVKSIGATGRDYSTIALWEAALNGAAGGSGNNAIGELYDDSTFSTSSSTVIWDTTPDNITLRAASGHEQDGTEDGAGATVSYTGTSRAIDFRPGTSGAESRVEGFRLLGTHSGGTLPIELLSLRFSTSTVLRVHNMFICYVYDASSTGGTNAIANGQSNSVVTNTIAVGARNGTGYALYDNAANATVLNCTLLRAARAYSGTATADNAVIKNCVGFDTSSEDFLTYGTPVTANNNASEDATAPGTSAVTGITPSSCFVDLTAGTLDLHLSSTSTAISKLGADLGTTPTGIDYDIDGQQRSEWWDIGADHRPPVIKSIGTSSRDYSTIALWEADHAGASGGAGNHAIGELYDDSDFVFGLQSFNDATPDYITLRTASGHEHDGTRDGAGVTLITTNGGNSFTLAGGSKKRHWLSGFRMELNGTGNYASTGVFCNNGYSAEIYNIIIFGDYASRANTNQIPYGIFMGTTVANAGSIVNCCFARLYNPHANTLNGRGIYGNYPDNMYICNNTIYDCGEGTWLGSSMSSLTMRNNISVGCANTDFIENTSSTGKVTSHNISSDTSAPDSVGSTSITGVSASSLLSDLTPGTIDFHLLNGSTSADGAGYDMGTTPAGIEYDIDLEARPSGNWDIGADQYIGASGVSGTLAAIAPAAESTFAGAVSVSGSVASTAPSTESTFAGAVLIASSVVVTAPAADSSFNVAVLASATLESTAPSSTSSFTVTVVTGVSGSMASVAPSAESSLTVAVLVAGTADSLAPAATSNLEADVLVSSSLGATAPNADATFDVDVAVAGTVDSTAPSAVSTFTTSVVSGVAANMAAIAPAAESVFAVEVPVASSMAAVAPAATSALETSVAITGTVSSVAPPAAVMLYVGSPPIGATFASTSGSATSSFAASVIVGADMNSTAGAASALFDVAVPVGVTLESVAPNATSSLEGAVLLTGTMDVVAPAAIARFFQTTPDLVGKLELVVPYERRNFMVLDDRPAFVIPYDQRQFVIQD